ncbi:flagellar basal body P-ring protein FlgI [Bryobacter aggregatus]|uniref:flagellar basal body P-ring protein FlgI n=1 Tax=Bryobacter aggregatus TaxID=360054 RepID=UPI0004E20878|nr:flagellar basal body P-ring protein FlgI [Bryobacter aggregatus]
MRLLLLLLITATTTLAIDARPMRVRELVALEGARENQLLGYGVVVGLNGTGDKRQSYFSAQSLSAMLDKLGVQVNPGSLLIRNVAAVMVTANLPPYAQNGTRLDVTVAAIGDAQNLQGGVLIQTPMRGANGKVYAVAQGPLVTGGFVARGGAGNQQTTNHPTVGRVINGGLLEADAPSIAPGARLRLQLLRADFGIAAKITEAINKKFPHSGEAIASAQNAGAILVRTPAEFQGREVEFYAQIEELHVSVERPSKVVINERTGTILIGKEVGLRPIAILHGALAIEISTTYLPSQPQPLSDGKTVVTPQIAVGVKEEKAKSVSLGAGATVDELVQALKQIGSTARDIIAILQALKSAGALEAEIEVL